MAENEYDYPPEPQGEEVEEVEQHIEGNVAMATEREGHNNHRPLGVEQDDNVSIVRENWDNLPTNTFSCSIIS